MPKEELQQLLQKLIYTIHSTINEDLATGSLQPENAPYLKWKLREFEYGDAGFVKKRTSTHEFLKPSWRRATWNISDKASKLSIYDEALSSLSKEYEIKEERGARYLQTLIIEVSKDILEGKIKALTDLSKYTISLLKDLNEEEQEYRAEVQLRGLILQPDSIQLDDNVRLRKPTRKDFEKEFPKEFSSFGKITLEDPTAFLHTRINAKAANTLTNEIDREIAVLRLFRVGAVQDIQYKMDSDSIIHIAGGTITRGKLLGEDKYLITKEDIATLKTFWLNMAKVILPSSICSVMIGEPFTLSLAVERHGAVEEMIPTKRIISAALENELSIAYERYTDSLEETIIEKQISSAVMGLEALYLYPSEQQELSYRLSMRAAKLLGLLGYDQTEVRERMKEAYDIRSTYVHGGILKEKDKRRYERKYGDINEFCKTIMDYLRASIVTLLNRPSKTSLIQKLDDSFLDSKKEEEIRKLLFMPYEKEVSNATG